MQKSDNNIATLSRNDWVIRLFMKLRMNPILVFFSVALFNLVLDFCLAKGYHAWDSTPTIHGLSMEPGGWAIDFIAEPLLFATYVWINEKAGSLITGLITNNRIQLNERARNEINKFRRKVGSAWFLRVSIILGSLINLLVAWFLLNDPANPTWLKANIVILIIRIIVGFPVYITGVMLLFYLYCFIFQFNKIIGASGIKIESRHPDKAGGFGEIGHMMSNFGYVILCFGLVLLLMFYQSYLNVNYYRLGEMGGAWLRGGFLYLLVYIIIAPLVFILPILSTHKAMVKHRAEILINISKDIDELFNNIYSNRSENPSKVKPLMQKLEQLEHLQDITLKFPTWPFSQTNLRKYIGLVTTPFTPILLGIIANKLYEMFF